MQFSTASQNPLPRYLSITVSMCCTFKTILHNYYYARLLFEKNSWQEHIHTRIEQITCCARPAMYYNFASNILCEVSRVLKNQV